MKRKEKEKKRKKRKSEMDIVGSSCFSGGEGYLPTSCHICCCSIGLKIKGNEKQDGKRKDKKGDMSKRRRKKEKKAFKIKYLIAKRNNNLIK
jgi:hypothetical protein